MARECADLLVGSTAQVRSSPAWVQVYRSLEHGIAENSCKNAATKNFPNEILVFANTFETMQEERHNADYDPESRYTRPSVLVLIDNCDQAIAALKAEPRSDRKAFAVWVLLQRKR